MIRMIATDLDGTLLATGGMTVPERNLRALERAVALGVRVVICTGRIFIIREFPIHWQFNQQVFAIIERRYLSLLQKL